MKGKDDPMYLDASLIGIDHPQANRVVPKWERRYPPLLDGIWAKDALLIAMANSDDK